MVFPAGTAREDDRLHVNARERFPDHADAFPTDPRDERGRCVGTQVHDTQVRAARCLRCGRECQAEAPVHSRIEEQPDDRGSRYRAAVDVLRAAFFWSTSTRRRPASGTTLLVPRTISRAVTLCP